MWACGLSPSEILEKCFLREFLRICFLLHLSKQQLFFLNWKSVGNCHLYRTNAAGACGPPACFTEELTSKVHFYPRLQSDNVACLLILTDRVCLLTICCEVEASDTRGLVRVTMFSE